MMREPLRDETWIEERSEFMELCSLLVKAVNGEEILRNPDNYTPLKRQQVWEFENGWGASVITGGYSYGAEKGLWELAVVTHEGDGELFANFSLNYDNRVISSRKDYAGVIPNLTEEQVQEILLEIESLPHTTAQDLRNSKRSGHAE